MFKALHVLLLLCLTAASAAYAQDNSQFISQSVPIRLAPGQVYGVSVTMKNTGTTTWNWEWYKLSAQNPYDNTVWSSDTRAYLPYGTYVYPGQQGTFNLNITAPSTPGIYNFQWRMIQEGVQVFGAITPNKVITVSVNPCASYANPNDNVADDVGLQCLLDQILPPGGKIKLASFTGFIEYGYIINSGLHIRAHNTEIDSAPGERAKALLKASSTLTGAIVLKSVNYNYGKLLNLVFDGNRDARNWQAICPDDFRPNVTPVEIFNSTGFEVRGSEFRRSPCGAALGVSGWNYTIDNNVFRDNGTGIESYIPPRTWPWADGIRVESCHGGDITNNRFYDSTDLSLSIEYTSNCDITGNKVYQVSRHAFGGFAIGNHDQPGTVMRGNTINGASKMSIGISVGGNPWCTRGAHGGATISYNTISGAYYGMNVQDSSHSIFGNNIQNYVSGGGCNTVKSHCNVHNSTNMQPCTTMTSYDLDNLTGNNDCCLP